MANTNSTEPGATTAEDSASPPLSEPDPAASGSAREPAIEAERARLMAVDSVLACVQIALDPDAADSVPEPYLPDVLALARKLLNESIDRLDTVHR